MDFDTVKQDRLIYINDKICLTPTSTVIYNTFSLFQLKNV